MSKLLHRTLWLRFALLIPVAFLPAACNDSDEQQSHAEAKLTDFSPTSARKGTMLTLNGENLGASRRDVKVWINSVETEVINVTQTMINLRVPDRVGSGPVEVMIGDKKYAYDEHFDYISEYNVSVYPGSGIEGIADGPVEEARFTRITSMVWDPVDKVVMTLETDNNPNQRVRRISGGQVETVTLFQSGQDIILSNPRSLEFSVTGDTLFVANDVTNFNDTHYAVTVLKRSENFAKVHPYIPYNKAGSNNVNYAAVNPVDGTVVYYCWSGKTFAWDDGNQTAIELDNVINIIKENNSSVTGSGNSLRFSADGRTLYLVLRTPHHGILSAGYDIANKSLTLPFRKFAGSGKSGALDGLRTEATMNQPMHCTIGSDGNLYVAERENNSIRRVTPEGEVTLFAGTFTQGNANGPAEEAQFFFPHSIVTDNAGTFYVGEYRNNDMVSGNRIKVITPEQ